MNDEIEEAYNKDHSFAEAYIIQKSGTEESVYNKREKWRKANEKH